MVNCINLIIEMSPRFVLGRENVPCVAEVVNRSLKADCTDFMIDVFNIALLTTEFGQVWAEYVCHDVTPQLWRKSEGKLSI